MFKKKSKKCVFCKNKYKYNCCFRNERYNINHHKNKKIKKMYKSPEILRKIKQHLAVICDSCVFCNKTKTLDCCAARQWLLSNRAEEATISYRNKTRGISMIRTPKEPEE